MEVIPESLRVCHGPCLPRSQKQFRVGRKHESNPRIETDGELSQLAYGGNMEGKEL